MSRMTKVLSMFLGILMLAFGFLKFFQPFYGWFEIQVRQSHLPPESILLGKLGEMATGFLFLSPWILRSLKERRKHQLTLLASSALIVQMLVATYVHLQPQVPSSVLPLGIKAPFMPLFVLVLGFIVAIATLRETQTEK